MKNIMAGLMLTVLSSLVSANDIKINQAWVRSTVVGQTTAGVFMEMVSTKSAALVKVRTDISKAELHEMKMQGDIMKMRQIKRIALNANKPVFLRPGGLHIMLLGLKKPLKVGSTVPLVLTFEFEDGSKDRVAVDVHVVDKKPEAGKLSIH